MCTFTIKTSIDKLDLCHDEVRILIFDDPAELEKSQRPFLEDFGGQTVKPPRERRARAMHEFPPENLRKPARAPCGPLCAGSFLIKSTVKLESTMYIYN